MSENAKRWTESESALPSRHKELWCVSRQVDRDVPLDR